MKHDDHISSNRFLKVLSVNQGLELEKQGRFAEAADLMQICVDFEAEIGHPDAIADAERVHKIREKAANS